MSPSETARHVAAYRLGFDRPAVPFGDPAADERLARDLATDIELGATIGRYLRARTAFFDRVVVEALDRGAAQIVIVGAGYDGRALRYAKPGVRWYEVDRPDTHADKRERLERLGIDASHVAFVAADLAVPGVDKALADAGYDARAPSLMLWEGVSVYLEETVLARVAAELADIAAAHSGLAMSAATNADEQTKERFTAGVAALGEPVRNFLGAAEVSAVLADAGWQPQPLSEAAANAGFVLATRAAPAPRRHASPPDTAPG